MNNNQKIDINKNTLIGGHTGTGKSFVVHKLLDSLTDIPVFIYDTKAVEYHKRKMDDILVTNIGEFFCFTENLLKRKEIKRYLFIIDDLMDAIDFDEKIVSIIMNLVYKHGKKINFIFVSQRPAKCEKFLGKIITDRINLTY